LLVCLSMVIFQDPVSLLQAFGYSIALAGMVYYKIGADATKEYVSQAGMMWADFGARRPVARKLVVLGAFFTGFVLLLFTFGPTYSPVSADQIYSKVGNVLGDKEKGMPITT
jgi:hypothetical protein